MSVDAATTLFYSDDPETVTTISGGNRDGVLFGFDIVPGEQPRLLFYHVNGLAQKRYFAVRLYNLSSTASTLEYVLSVAPATTQYIDGGHAATAAFVRALVNQDWRSQSLAANENAVVASIQASQNDLATGMLEFRGSTAPIRCSVIACDSLENTAAIARAGDTFSADAKHRRGKFALGSFRAPIFWGYSVGAPSSLMRIGERVVPNQEGQPEGSAGVRDVGEYGVFTHLDLTLTNGTDQDTTVAMYQSAHGGPSTATYVIDGKIVESATMDCREGHAPPRYKLWIYTVPARGVLTSQIMTMPDAGSSSPIVMTLDANDDSTDPGASGSVVSLG